MTATLNTTERQRALDDLQIPYGASLNDDQFSDEIKAQIQAHVESADLPDQIPWPVGCTFVVAGDQLRITYPDWDVGPGESYLIDTIDLDGVQVPKQTGRVGGRLSMFPNLREQAPIEWITRTMPNGDVLVQAMIRISMPGASVRAVFFDDERLVPRKIGKVDLYKLFPLEIAEHIMPGDKTPRMRYGTQEEYETARTLIREALGSWGDTPR